MPNHHQNDPMFEDIGPCIVSYKGTVIGATMANPEGGTHGGCTVRCTKEYRNSMRDVEGLNEHNAYVVGETWEVQCNFTGLSLEQLEDIVPGLTMSAASTPHKKLKIGNAIGSSMRAFAGELILKQAEDGIASTDERDWMRLHLAYPLPNIEFSFDLENQKVYTVTFRGLRRLTDGEIGYIGQDETTT